MAAISTLTYPTITPRIVDASPSYKEVFAVMQFGNGVDTYPTGGVLFQGAAVGLPNFVEAVGFLDSIVTGGYFAQYNRATGRIMLFTNAGVEISNALTPNAAIPVIMRGY